MEQDPTREFLQSVAEARVEAGRLHRKINRLQTQAESITAQLTGMPHGGNADAEKTWAVLADTRAEYAKKLVAAEQIEKDVSAFIDTLPTKESRIILRLRYLDCLRWPLVWKHMEEAGLYYEERQVYRLHGKALNEARELYTSNKGETE